MLLTIPSERIVQETKDTAPEVNINTGYFSEVTEERNITKPTQTERTKRDLYGSIRKRKKAKGRDILVFKLKIPKFELNYEGRDFESDNKSGGKLLHMDVDKVITEGDGKKLFCNTATEQIRRRN